MSLIWLVLKNTKHCRYNFDLLQSIKNGIVRNLETRDNNVVHATKLLCNFLTSFNVIKHLNSSSGQTVLKFSKIFFFFFQRLLQVVTLFYNLGLSHCCKVNTLFQFSMCRYGELWYIISIYG